MIEVRELRREFKVATSKGLRRNYKTVTAVDGVSQSPRFAGRDEQTRFLMDDEFFDAVDGCSHDGQRRIHCLC